MNERGYSAKQTAEIVGITYRQLDHWTRTKLVTPSLAAAVGSGSRRQYSYTELLELKVIKALLDSGARLEGIRQVFEFMRGELGAEIVTANLVISGSDLVWVKSPDEIVELLKTPGQGVLQVLPIGSIKEDLEADVIEFRAQQPAMNLPAKAATGSSPLI